MKKKKITIKVKQTASQRAKKRRNAIRKEAGPIHRPTKAHVPKTQYKRSKAKQELRKQISKEA